MNILEHMSKIKIPESEHQGEYIYSSEVTYCQRKIYYKLCGLKGWHSFKSETRMLQGNVVHELFQSGFEQVVKELGYDRAFSEVRSVCGDIHGRIDVMLVSPNKKMIIEIKTVEKLPKFPLKHHISQVNTYLRNYVLNSKQHNYEVTGMLYYIDRAGKGDAVFTVEYSEELYQKDEKYAKEILNYYNKGELPPPTALMDKNNYWECSYCPFLLHCKKDYNPKS